MASHWSTPERTLRQATAPPCTIASVIERSVTNRRTHNRRTSFVPALIGIAAVALGLRVWHLTEITGTPLASILMGDGLQYDQWARRIVAGEWLGSETFYQSPLYPYFLAVIYSLTDHSVTAVRVVQAMLGALSCVWLGIAGRTFFDDRVGLCAAGLLAIFPWAIFAEGLIQKSAIDGVLITALLATLAAFARRPGPRWLWAAGVVLAALALNRESARILFPIVAIWVYAGFAAHPRGSRLRWVAAFVVAAALVTVPVGVRNLVVGGEFLISTSQSGPNFYIGNNPKASGTYEPLVADGGRAEHERGDAIGIAEQISGRPLSPAEVSTFWWRRAIADISTEPVAWLRLTFRKVLLAVNAGELVDTESLAVYAEHSRPLRLLSWFSFGLLVPLTVLGLWHTGCTRTRAVLHWSLGALLVTVVAFYVVDRYRYPLVPLALLFSAAGLQGLAGFWARSVRARVLGIALVVAATVLPYLPLTRGMTDPTIFNVGMAYLASGQPAEALPWLQEATKRTPEDADAHFGLGDAYRKTGDISRSIQALQQAVRLRSDDWQLQGALGLAMRAGGSVHAAIPYLEQSARLNPASAGARFNLGRALADTGNLDRSVTELREAHRLDPDDAGIVSTLAAVLHATGQTAEALALLETRVAARPTEATSQETLAGILEQSAGPAAAEAQLRRALSSAPTDPDFWLMLGRLLQRQERLAEAIVHAREAVRAAPRTFELRYFLVEVLVADRRFDDAEQALAEALAQARAIGATQDITRIETLRAALRGR